MRFVRADRQTSALVVNSLSPKNRPLQFLQEIDKRLRNSKILCKTTATL